jgi:hypothetical protein
MLHDGVRIRTRQHDGRVELDAAAAAGRELASGAVRIAWLLEQAAFAFGDLIGANNPGLGVAAGYGGCLLLRQAQGASRRGFPGMRSFVHLRRLDLERHPQARQELGPIPGGRSQEEDGTHAVQCL